MTLWARSGELATSIEQTRVNARYLPGVALPETLHVTASLRAAVAAAGVVLVAVPSHGFRRVLEEMAPALVPRAVVVSLAKGIEPGTSLRMSEIVAELAPDNPAGVLTGPNLAREVAAIREQLNNQSLAIGILASGQSVADLHAQLRATNAVLTEMRAILAPAVRNTFVLNDAQEVRAL